MCHACIYLALEANPECILCILSLQTIGPGILPKSPLKMTKTPHGLLTKAPYWGKKKEKRKPPTKKKQQKKNCKGSEHIEMEICPKPCQSTTFNLFFKLSSTTFLPLAVW